MLRGISKLNPHTPRQPLPITPSVLLNMREQLDLQSPLHAVLWCCFIFTLFLFARKSSMVPPKAQSFGPQKHLRRGDILECEAGLLVYIKWSKTIQHGERYLMIPISAKPSSPLCPLKAFQQMCQLMPAGKSAPAFVIPRESGLTSLTHSSMVAYLSNSRESRV